MKLVLVDPTFSICQTSNKNNNNNNRQQIQHTSLSWLLFSGSISSTIALRWREPASLRARQQQFIYLFRSATGIKPILLLLFNSFCVCLTEFWATVPQTQLNESRMLESIDRSMDG